MKDGFDRNERLGVTQKGLHDTQLALSIVIPGTEIQSYFLCHAYF